MLEHRTLNKEHAYGKNSGETQEVIQSRLGHSSSKVTTTYIQQNIEDKKKELKPKHISIPLSSTTSSTENKKISDLKNKIVNIKTNSYKEFIKKIIEFTY